MQYSTEHAQTSSRRPAPPPLAAAIVTTTVAAGRDGAFGPDSSLVAAWRAAGESVLWVMLDRRVAAACRLSDMARGETAAAVRDQLCEPRAEFGDDAQTVFC